MPAFKRVMGFALLALGACGSSLAQADLYRYIDDKGVTVLDSRVPPQFISRGYEVLDSQGRVKASIDDLQLEREELQSRAAQAERAGREVDPDLLAELSAVDAETARLQRLISHKRQEIVENNAEFDRQRERLKFLLNEDD